MANLDFETDITSSADLMAIGLRTELVKSLHKFVQTIRDQAVRELDLQLEKIYFDAANDYVTKFQSFRNPEKGLIELHVFFDKVEKQ